MVLVSVAAWSRALAILFFTIPVVNAHEDRLFTSSVTYCAQPRAILISEFNIQYVRDNSTVIFNIAAASVEKDLNVTGNLMLNVYGMNSLNVTFDFCTIASGILCPLPTYNFNGSGIIPLDFYSNLLGGDVSKHVPSIAYVVPDIEAFAQLTLRRVEDGEVVACVQSTLANGWSMHQPRVSWATGIVAVFALLAALFQSRFQLASLNTLTTASTSPSYATTRFIDLLHFLQHICLTGLVSVNYPLAYRQFVLNFAWAFGLIRIGSIQRAIDRLRHRTGGVLPSGSLDSIDYTNRRMSPYNVPPPDGAGHVNLAMPATVTSKDADALPAGIPTFVNSLQISNQNAFLTIFFTLLLLMAAAILFFGLLYVALWAVHRVRGARTPEWVVSLERDYILVLKTHAVLLAFVCLVPVMTFAFFQWSFKDSWFATLFSVLVFLLVLGGCIFPLARTFLASRRCSSSDELLGAPELAYVAPVTFGQFRPQRWSFTDLTIIATFVKALVIVLGPPRGLFQVIFLLSVEVLFFVALCFARPYRSRGGDAMAIFLAVIRVVTVALLIPFAQSLSIKPIPRAVLGIGSAVVSSVAVVVLFFSILLNAVWGTFRLPWRRQRSETPASASSSTVRGSAEDEDKDSWRRWSPTASAKHHLATLPPRPGPPEPSSRFASPGIDADDDGVRYASAPYSAGAMSEFTMTDIGSGEPETPRRHSGTTISSYGAWNGLTNASAPATPSTPGASSSAYHSAATHRLEPVDEAVDVERR